MWAYIHTDELYHHGIKGQRWGVRRFQEDDGSLTPAGKRRYDDDNSSSGNKQNNTSTEKKKSKHRLKLEAAYMQKKGMSQEEAEKAASNRIRTEKTLAVVGAATVAAAAAYFITKKVKADTDGLIKGGTSLQRVEMTNEATLHDRFYVAKDNADKTKYAGKLGLLRKHQVGKAYIMDIGVKDDIKIAGNKQAFKTFEELYNKDSSFRDNVNALAKKNVHGGNAANGNMKKLYENFNSWLVVDRGNDRDLGGNKFYSALKEKGYGAVRDINDMKFSGYKAKNPLIVFGQKDNVMVKTFKELNDSDIGKNLKKDGMRETAGLIAAMGAVTVPSIAVSTYMDSASLTRGVNTNDQQNQVRR